MSSEILGNKVEFFRWSRGRGNSQGKKVDVGVCGMDRVRDYGDSESSEARCAHFLL